MGQLLLFILNVGVGAGQEDEGRLVLPLSWASLRP